MIAPSVKPRRARLSLGREDVRTLRTVLEDALILERDGGLPDEVPVYIQRMERLLAKLSKATRYVEGTNGAR